MWYCTEYDDLDNLERQSPTRQVSLSDDVFRHIRLRILNGEFIGGEKVFESVLAKELDVSRATVREATRRLSGLGLLDIDPQRGVFVRLYDFEDIKDLYDLRDSLCDLTARLFVQRASEADLCHIQMLIEKTADVTHETYQNSDYIKALAFSEAVVRAARNAKLFELYHQSWQQFRLFKMHLLRSGFGNFNILEYNRELFFDGHEHRSELNRAIRLKKTGPISDAMQKASKASRQGALRIHRERLESAKLSWRPTPTVTV